MVDSPVHEIKPTGDVLANDERDNANGSESAEASSKQSFSESADESSTSHPQSSNAGNAGPWQAIYSPQYNAYYFYNTVTKETTWDNPLSPSASSSSQPPNPAQEELSEASELPAATSYTALQQAAISQGIDPALAHLDPSLLPSTSNPTSQTNPVFAARFNARTGQFTRADARDPSHLSEYARMTRMSEFYFDVEAWEAQLAQQGGSIMGEGDTSGNGKKRKRPTKKDLERFKEQKRLKKIAKTAWLRT